MSDGHDVQASRDEAAPYGTWASPIDAEALLAGVPGLHYPRVWEGTLYWLEARPQERGRSVVVRLADDGRVTDCVPQDANVRSRVHEYGGICHTVHDGRLYYVEFSDQRIHRIDLAQDDVTPVALTPDDGSRYADLQVDGAHDRLIAVREAHDAAGEVRNTLVAVPLDGGAPVELAAGADFYASPSPSPAGDQLLWLQWNHPCMPWDGCELRQAAMDESGEVRDVTLVAGGEDVSIFQPGWSDGDDTRPVFVSDEPGWWNLHRAEDEGVRCLHHRDADFGLPLWQFGMRTWAMLADGRIACIRCEDGVMRLGLLARDGASLTDLELPWTHFDGIDAHGSTVYVSAAAPDRFTELVAIDCPADGSVGAVEILRRSRAVDLHPRDLSRGEAVAWGEGERAARG